MKTAKEAYNDERRNSIYRSEKCRALLNRDDVSDLYALFQMGRSFGGARPKVMTDETVMAFSRASDAEQDAMRPTKMRNLASVKPSSGLQSDKNHARIISISNRLYQTAAESIRKIGVTQTWNRDCKS